jgi:hypothetical protein
MQTSGITIACGTAFVASSSSGAHFLLTNRHNVTGRHHETGEVLCTKTAAVPDALVVWHNSSAGLGQFVQVDVPLIDNDTPQWIEHPVLREKADFVALPITARQDIALYPYRAEYLAHMHIEPAQTVSVVGFPFGERTGASFAVWATGFVASEPEINHGGRPVFLIDCRSRKGQSGSPVIRYHNGGGLITHENGVEVVSPVCRLLGIYSGRINDESDLGVVWKARAIAELLDYASTI